MKKLSHREIKLICSRSQLIGNKARTRILLLILPSSFFLSLDQIRSHCMDWSKQILFLALLSLFKLAETDWIVKAMILNLMTTECYILKMELLGEQRKPRFSQVARALLLRYPPQGQIKAGRRVQGSPFELLPTLPAPKIFPLPLHSRKLQEVVGPILHTSRA